MSVLLTKGGGRDPRDLLESFREKAAGTELKPVTDVLNAEIGGEQEGLCSFYLDRFDVVVDIVSGFRFEFSGKIIFHVTDPFGDVGETEFLFGMQFDIVAAVPDLRRILGIRTLFVDELNEFVIHGMTDIGGICNGSAVHDVLDIGISAGIRKFR